MWRGTVRRKVAQSVCVEYLTLMKERLLQGVLVTVVQYIAFRAVILVWRTRTSEWTTVVRDYKGKLRNGKGSEKPTARIWEVPLYAQDGR